MVRLIALLASLVLMVSPASADPLSIGVAFLVNIGYGGAISALGATLVGSAVLGAGALGLSLLSSAVFSQNGDRQPSPSERQSTVRQSIGPRVRHYGRVKVGGTLFFFENKDENLYQGVTLNEGEISGIFDLWLNDQSVTTDGMGFVNNEPYVLDNGTKVVRMLFKYGRWNQTAQEELVANFPGQFTPDHRLRGVANYVVIFQEVPREEISVVYPQLNPNVRIVMNASIVKSVRTGNRIWSANPADCIYDYLTARDVAGFPYGAGYLESQIDLASFQEFAHLCDETVMLKSGTSIARYSLWGGYALNEEMRQVLPRMLRTCDGDLYLTTDGKIGIRGGQWKPPVLTLDDSLGHILSAEFRRGTQALAAFNELTTTYVEQALDYQETEAQPWVDAQNVALRGRAITSKLDLLMVPTHAQARRLAKIHTIKSNPEWSGRIVTNFYGFNALNEQVVRLIYSPLNIDQTFLIRRVSILGDITGVEITLTSLSNVAYQWDAFLEEGTAPNSPPDTSTPIDLPPPDGFYVTVRQRIVSGSVIGLYIEATWIEPDRTALRQEVQHRLSPSGDWFNMSVSDGVGLAESGIVEDGATYDVRIRTLAPAGTPGPWSLIQTVVAVVPFTVDTSLVRVDTNLTTSDRV